MLRKERTPRCVLTAALAAASLLVLLASAPAASAQDAYVANFNSDSVSVIDTASKAVTATIAVQSQPICVAFTPDGAEAYVTNFGSDSVSVIDTATEAVTATIGVQGQPKDVAISPDGAAAYVVNQNSDSVSVIDTATKAVTAAIAVQDSPSELAITPDGAFAYVTNGNSNSVSVIDIAAEAVTATIPVSGPSDLAITPDGAHAYVTSEDGTSVSVIGTATNSVTATIGLQSGPNGVAITPDGTRAYVASQVPGSVSVIDTATNTVTTTITLSVGAWQVAITPDSAFAYVTNYIAGTVSVIDTATDTVTTTIIGGFATPHEVAIMPAAETPGDSTDPTVTITSPADGATHQLGESVTADFACADENGGSGLADCVGTVADGDLIDTGTVGSKQFTVTAHDNAGNETTVTHDYSVGVYAFAGFFAPIDNDALNMLKAGQGAPLRFSLGGDQGVAILATGSPSSRPVQCDSTLPSDPVEQTVTAGASGLSYDAATDVYTYTWKTDKAWAGTCRELTVTLTNGTSHSALFMFSR
jgi:YVTN family beta-propeller protein